MNDAADHRSSRHEPSGDVLSLSGAQVLSRWLLCHGMDTVFAVPGSQVMPVIDTLHDNSGLRLITAAHELGAAYMADGLARRSGHPVACVSIGGPGAGNMLTAAATAFQDDSPVLYITGDVDSRYRGMGAFQDAGPQGSDDGAMFLAAIKHSTVVHQRVMLSDMLDKAWERLQQGRPAHIVLPIDVQIAACADPVVDTRDDAVSIAGHAASLPRRLVQQLAQARHPLVLAGQRVAPPRLRGLLQGFCEAWNLPLITTLAAKGVVPETHPLCLGNAGYAGQPRANAALLDPAVDLLLVIGADFNERDTLAWHPGIKPATRRIVHLDARVPTGINRSMIDALYAPLDLATYLQAMQRLAPASPPLRGVPHYPAGAKPQPLLSNDDKVIRLGHLMPTLQAALPADTACFVDSGSSRVFAGQLWCAASAGCYFSAASSAPMGWAIGAGIGAACHQPATPPLVLTGDGSMLMHGLEIAAAAHHGIALVIVLIDNGGHGPALRAHRHQSDSSSPYISPAVDWVAFARSLGARAQRIGHLSEVAPIIGEALQYPGPSVLHVRVDPHEPHPFPVWAQ